MRNFLTNLNKKIDEWKKIIAEKNGNGIKRLETVYEEIVREFEKRIAVLNEKRNLIKEAFAQKLSLRKWKVSVLRTLAALKLRYLLSIPLIYGMIIPAVLFDLAAEIYQNVCFRLWKIPRVKRRDYFIIDRHYLAYLNVIEKFNCIYCGYFNGLVAYIREIAARTERYWCPIKHAQKPIRQHSQYALFVEYLDGQSYRELRLKLRDFEKDDGQAMEDPEK